MSSPPTREQLKALEQVETSQRLIQANKNAALMQLLKIKIQVARMSPVDSRQKYLK